MIRRREKTHTHTQLKPRILILPWTIEYELFQHVYSFNQLDVTLFH